MRMILTLCASATLLAACGGNDAALKKGREAPLVTLAAVQPARFVERIDAVGTARANEQVTLTAPVTQRIVRLNFDDGAYVAKGQVIAVLETATQSAQLAQAQARAREAHQQLERLEALKARGFATRSAVDTQVALAGQANAQAAEARAGINDRVVRAPFGGWVSLRNISAGAVVTAGTEIVTVSDVSRIKLDFPVPETLLAQLKPGQPIVAVAAAYPDQPFRGTVDTVDPVLNPQTRATTVRAVLANGDRRLKPGMLLTVTIESAERTVPAVPELALVGEGENMFVFTVENGKAKRVQVRTGLRQNGMVEIVDGLRAGQRVVTEGVVKIADGQAVRTGAADNAKGRSGAAAKADEPKAGGKAG
ncbi:efflux RND transporter periplasmic adaptor subunit [Sphingomonas koreensis]|uniref:efflux RND transporter periplasmic adaptor subunit n=1 Tax=Sphingomonas koreensis TaxID=93064 RepID=UPI00082F7B88|nr:efflux RND transporter periplasmic adaptor subunit [Sphingomonas koreensis]PJI90467.1 membrane fusion protein (multidrug efflux system) [Sphingomonas koreensis]RSU58979.1 efflux RND transporter periplasmic adaptor subunit [Sphingomonas koreensis]RSU67531.1 efflux RND transporter periplasmic adaptor subunit [Sphingomonas koreensis]